MWWFVITWIIMGWMAIISHTLIDYFKGQYITITGWEFLIGSIAISLFGGLLFICAMIELWKEILWPLIDHYMSKELIIKRNK